MLIAQLLLFFCSLRLDFGYYLASELFFAAAIAGGGFTLGRVEGKARNTPKIIGGGIKVT